MWYTIYAATILHSTKKDNLRFSLSTPLLLVLSLLPIENTSKLIIHPLYSSMTTLNIIDP